MKETPVQGDLFKAGNVIGHRRGLQPDALWVMCFERSSSQGQGAIKLHLCLCIQLERNQKFPDFVAKTHFCK